MQKHPGIYRAAYGAGLALRFALGTAWLILLPAIGAAYLAGLLA